MFLIKTKDDNPSHKVYYCGLSCWQPQLLLQSVSAGGVVTAGSLNLSSLFTGQSTGIMSQFSHGNFTLNFSLLWPWIDSMYLEMSATLLLCITMTIYIGQEYLFHTVSESKRHHRQTEEHSSRTFFAGP